MTVSLGINAVDGAMFAVVVLTSLYGLWRGLASELCWLAAYAAAGLLAWRYAAPLARALAGRGPVPESWAPVAALVALVGGVLLAAFLLGLVVRRLATLTFIDKLSRAGGAVAGSVRGCALAAFVFVVGSLWPGEGVRRAFSDSLTGRRLGTCWAAARAALAPAPPAGPAAEAAGRDAPP